MKDGPETQRWVKKRNLDTEQNQITTTATDKEVAMKTYRVHDKKVVVVLNMKEAKALKQRLVIDNCGVRKSNALISAFSKLVWAIDAEGG